MPHPLPPQIELSWELASEISAADRGLSELAGIARTLPNPHLLIRPFMSREAVLTSRIEGTQASLSDLFYFEAASATPPADSDLREVQNLAKDLLTVLPCGFRDATLTAVIYGAPNGRP